MPDTAQLTKEIADLDLILLGWVRESGPKACMALIIGSKDRF
jgi:hypothetical protein